MTTNPTVYLAGPITGLTFDGCTDWRQHAIERLAKHGIVGVSPLRAQDYLKQLGDAPLSGHGREYAQLGVLVTPRAISARDRFDVRRCSVVLAHLAGAKQVSIGTVMEIAWADAHRVPVVATLESDLSNPHEHLMVTEAIDFRVEALEQALDVAIAILQGAC